jgi:ubiquinone/menaquinone biosynthesis C-methylase UbiE
MLSWGSYWLSQNARVGWYLGQYLLSNRLTRAPASAQPSELSARQPVAVPSLGELLQELRALLVKDWRNIRDGFYRAPVSEDAARIISDAVLYFRDLPAVTARRKRRDFDEVRREAGAAACAYPDYYLRNFHYQTDGYLSELSAKLYDHQVEVLFFGGADAMRRQALVPIGAFARARRGFRLKYLDVACGTGRFMASVLDNFARLDAIGIDLSPNYLAEARQRFGVARAPLLIQGLAENLPLARDSVDITSCVYLLHEVPAEVRFEIIREFARVLRRGGRVVVVDSLQFGDKPSWDGLLAGFPEAFHEPFHSEYAKADLLGLFAEAGLRHVGTELAFLSKVLVFDKP